MCLHNVKKYVEKLNKNLNEINRINFNYFI